MESTLKHPLDANSQLVFLHLQKTAGMTLHAVLDAQFSGPRISPIMYQIEFMEHSPEALERFSLLHGHYFYGILSRLLRGRPIYMTFLRDPVERALSQYAHMQTRQVDPPHAYGVGMDLESFVFHPNASKHITNLQTRMLGARFAIDETRDIADALEAEELLVHMGKGATAAEAIEVLESIAYFGLTEQFNDSMALLTYTFDWLPTKDVTSRNIGTNKPVRARIPAHVMERIIELNQEDIILYQHAQRLFATRYNRMLYELLAAPRRAADRTPTGVARAAVDAPVRQV